MRNIETDPYRNDEMRVVEYLRESIPAVGAGDDPIGFLIASHAAIVIDNLDLKIRIVETTKDWQKVVEENNQIKRIATLGGS